VQRFIDTYFDRFEGLQKPPYHPKWKNVNLAAQVPGWTRYSVAEEKLKQIVAAKAPPAAAQARAQPVRTGTTDTAAQEKLFQQFLEWSRKQGKK
jgi:hypothetical protein